MAIETGALDSAVALKVFHFVEVLLPNSLIRH